MQVSLPVKEEKLGPTFADHLRLLFFNSPFVVAIVGYFAELTHSVLVCFELFKVAFESVNSPLELVLLQDDLPQLPLTKLGRPFFSVQFCWLEGVKGFVGDGLAEVNFFELLV